MVCVPPPNFKLTSNGRLGYFHSSTCREFGDEVKEPSATASSARLSTICSGSLPSSFGAEVACESCSAARSKAERISSLLRPITTGGTAGESPSSSSRASSAIGRMETVSWDCSSGRRSSESSVTALNARSPLRLTRRRRVSNPTTTSWTSFCKS